MRESDIRSSDLLNEYLRLSAEDAQTFFPDASYFENRACPGCGGNRFDAAFDKGGFTFGRCGVCGTLYADPAPRPNALDAFYSNSPSQRYWGERFFPPVAEARREKIFRPRVSRIKALMAEGGMNVQRVIDVGAGTGIFLEEARRASLAPELIAVEPTSSLAEQCRASGFETFHGFAADAARDAGLAERADLAVCFEVIEHVLSPRDLLCDLAKLVRPGGWVLATGLAGSGFDILELGPRSKAVSPPHHLNFLTEQGVIRLSERAGLELVSFLTPGQLDVDIVRGLLSEQPNVGVGGFARHMALYANEEQRSAFQKFLAEHRLSSHMWILARRPAA